MKTVISKAIKVVFSVGVLVVSNQLWAHEGHGVDRNRCSAPCKVSEQSSPHAHMSDHKNKLLAD